MVQLLLNQASGRCWFLYLVFGIKVAQGCFDSDPALWHMQLSNDFGRCLSQEPRRLCTSTPQYRVCRTWCVYIWQSLAKAVGASARGCKSSLALEEQQLLTA